VSATNVFVTSHDFQALWLKLEMYVAAEHSSLGLSTVIAMPIHSFYLDIKRLELTRHTLFNATVYSINMESENVLEPTNMLHIMRIEDGSFDNRSGFVFSPSHIAFLVLEELPTKLHTTRDTRPPPWKRSITTQASKTTSLFPKSKSNPFNGLYRFIVSK